MCKSRLITQLPVLLSLIALSQSFAQQPSVPLNLEDVVTLFQNGVSEEVIVTKIKKNGKAFDLSTEELLTLRKFGITDTIVKYLLDPSQAYAPAPPVAPASLHTDPPPAPAKPTPPSRKFPDDPLSARVPPEPGLYQFQLNAAVKTDIKMLLGESQGPGLGKVLLRKGKVTAYLVGSSAKTRVTDSDPVFYLRLPEGKSIEEVLLLTLDRNRERREIDLGPPGPKPEFKAETMKPFDSLEVGPRVFRLSTSKLRGAEYFFYLIGSAEAAKGNYGKGYDFGIDMAEETKKYR